MEDVEFKTSGWHLLHFFLFKQFTEVIGIDMLVYK